MPGPAPVRQRLAWRTASVVGAIAETPSARTLTLGIPGWDGHRAGQHLDIRLTAEDGYQAVRSYSLSSGPGEAPAPTVESVDDGEVSPFLVEVVELGDTFEVRGPIGGYFALEPGPQCVLLVGGGSGIAPLRSMWRAQAAIGPVAVLVSARSARRLIYRSELDAAAFDVRVTLTREPDPRYGRGRLDQPLIDSVVAAHRPDATYVCGPTAFVEDAADMLLAAGIAADAIRTERFG